MHWPQFIIFASDATIVGLWGGSFLLIALLALAADWRRAKRRHIDRVGWVPWTPVFLGSLTLGAGLMMMALKGWLGS